MVPNSAFFSLLRSLWPGSDVGLDKSKKRSRHQFSKVLAFNPVLAFNNSSNNYSETVMSVCPLKFKCVLLRLAELAHYFSSVCGKGKGVLTAE